jgi:hypothetical protein
MKIVAEIGGCVKVVVFTEYSSDSWVGYTWLNIKEVKMARKMSRAERKQAFMAKAEAMFEHLESWYDEHPDATFGEIEQAAREERRRFMRHGLEVLINGRDTGKKDSAPQCAACGEAMTFKGYRHKSVRAAPQQAPLPLPIVPEVLSS